MLPLFREGAEHQERVKTALGAPFADDPQERLRAIESLPEGVSGATRGGSVSVDAVLEKFEADAPVRAMGRVAGLSRKALEKAYPDAPSHFGNRLERTPAALIAAA